MKSNKSSIEVAFAINKGYIEQLEMSIFSLLRNNHNQSFRVHILSTDLTAGDRQHIVEVVSTYGDIEVEFPVIDSSRFDGLKLNIDHISVETYYRYILAEILPKNIKKIIYLDADILVIGDISGLWSTNLENNYIAGVEDSFIVDEKYKPIIGLTESDRYVNAGVLLFNLDLIRKDDKTKELFENTIRFNDVIQYQDQDILNITFKTRIKVVDIKYNFTSRDSVKYPEKCNSVVIIHYTGSVKPWDDHPEGHLYTHSLYNTYLDLKSRYDRSGVDNMSDLQKTILQIYKEFKRICDLHNLRYYANGGTKIGAVRHGGFIPWYDDIDIDMPIEDYVKFIEIAPKEMSPRYGLKKMFGGITHTMIDKNTMYTEYFYLGYPEKYSGVFVDIYPIFGTPNDEGDRNDFIDDMYTLSNDIIFKSIAGEYSDDETAQRQEFIKYQKLASKYDVDNSDFVLTILGQMKSAGLYETDKFLNYWNVKFEDTTIHVPIEFDSQLKKQYGDYSLRAAPKNEIEKSIHKSRAIIDLDKSYAEYAKAVSETELASMSRYLTRQIAMGWYALSCKDQDLDRLTAKVERLKIEDVGVKKSFKRLIISLINKFKKD